jgi:tetratricopeptide (TPR) repeat protein
MKLMTPNIKYLQKIIFASLSLLCVLPLVGQTPSTKLELGKPLGRQIKGGETNWFEFEVKAGFYARIEVEQKNIEVIVSLLAPEGKQVIEMRGDHGSMWRESLSCIADKNGFYRVEIKALDDADSIGRYTVKLAELRQSVPNDQKRLQAEAHLSSGRRLNEFFGANNLEAIKQYETALSLWREIGEKDWEASTLLEIASANSHISKHEQAIEASLQAVELFQQTKNRIGEIKALSGLGSSHSQLMQFEKAQQFLEKALNITRELKNYEQEEQVLKGLAISLKDTNKELALHYWNQAFDLSKKFKNYATDIKALVDEGISYLVFFSESEKAHQIFQEVIAASQKLKDRKKEISTLEDIAHFYSRNPNVKLNEKAISYYERALAIAKEIKDLMCNSFELSSKPDHQGQAVFS